MNEKLPPIDPADIKDVVGMIGQAVDEMLNKNELPIRWGFFHAVVETGRDNPTMELFYNIQTEHVILMLKEVIGRLEGRIRDEPGHS